MQGDVTQVVTENQQEQEDLKQMARQYAEWREQAQRMQADIHLILQHLEQEMRDGADGGKKR